jgi:N-methylhydantoinase A
VPVPDGADDRPLAEATVAAFHDAHQRLYGYSFRDDPTQQVEWVNLRVTGIGPIRRPTLRPLRGEGGEPPGINSPLAPGSGGTVTPTASPTRAACFDPARGFVDTAIYRREDLGPGDLVAGPAVVEEYGATVPLHPGFGARVDRFGNLVVERREAR